MTLSLIENSDNFLKSFKKDALKAEKRIYIQTLSFEGDKAGELISSILLKKKGLDIKLLIDDYNNYFINDQFIYSPFSFFKKEIINGKKAGKALQKKLIDSGIKIKTTNPAGFFLKNLIKRNHKKIFLTDNTIYIGGINITDHNFSWRDIMIKIDDKNVSKFIKNDFKNTWEKKSGACFKKFKGMEIISLNGKNNKKGYKKILNLIDSAKKKIWVISPYLSFPFTNHLAKKSKQGVLVNIISPKTNNYKFFNIFIKNESKNKKFNLFLYKKNMNHLKAILIDGKKLIIGSSNFDFLSYYFYSEIIAVITDKKFIKDFFEKIIKKDLKESIKY